MLALSIYLLSGVALAATVNFNPATDCPPLAARIQAPTPETLAPSVRFRGGLKDNFSRLVATTNKWGNDAKLRNERVETRARQVAAQPPLAHRTAAGEQILMDPNDGTFLVRDANGEVIFFWQFPPKRVGKNTFSHGYQSHQDFFQAMTALPNTFRVGFKIPEDQVGGFGNEGSLAKHFDRHGAEFRGTITAAAYESAAKKFVADSAPDSISVVKQQGRESILIKASFGSIPRVAILKKGPRDSQYHLITYHVLNPNRFNTNEFPTIIDYFFSLVDPMHGIAN